MQIWSNRMVLDKREMAVIGDAEHVVRHRGCLRSHLSQHERRFVESYFSLDRDNVVFISSRKLLQQSGLIKNLFRHVVQKGLLDQIAPLDDYLQYLNRAMMDSGIYICRIASSGVLDWQELGPCGSQIAMMTAGNGTKNRFSLAEWLGRLAFYGFDIIEHKLEMTQVTIAVMKTGSPKSEMLPSRSWFYRMERVGFQGKTIGVYKIRTMYPFSEYLQDYIVRLNGYNRQGKPAKDFRITRWGRLLRKYWLDELPQVLNLLKGEMSLVGVRPLSRIRFSELPESLQEERVRFKPGCIPPYVALCMSDARSNIVAEQIYLAEKKNHPLKTDVRYFFKAIFNIFTGRIVSS